jgi:hypothetical protein
MKNITNATINSIIRNGGATINYNGERVQMKSGYQVSKHDLVVMPAEDFNKYIIKALVATLTGRGEYLGVWVDNNKVYIDVSHRVATKREAMERGRELNQLTVLQWSTMQCLEVV